MTISVTNYQDLLEGNYGLILTANSIEKAAVTKVLGKCVRAEPGVAQRGAMLCYNDPHILLHVTGTAGNSTETSVGHIARHFLSGRGPTPAFVILAGFCWGNPDMVAIGDVVIATTVASINNQCEGTTGRTYRRTDKSSPLEVSVALLDEIAAGKPFANHLGTIGSAELYLAADGARNALIAQHPDLLGGEMEAFGFLTDLGDIPWFVVKGVSDDAGDATGTSGQNLAAERAATVLADLIRGLTTSNVLLPPKSSPARDALIDAIIGDSIVVSRPADMALVNDYLNNDIGPRVEHRLARYISDDCAQAGLHRALMKLILEVIQNALRHGNASRAALAFYETRIDLIDNGEDFELASLQGDRGGAMAWEDFDARFVSTDMATVSRKKATPRGNHYSFKINLLTEALRIARTKCSATILDGAIGAPGGSAPVLRYDADCQTIHVSVHNVRMISRSRVIVQAIIAELEAGKTVYIACPDTDEMLVHERMLKEYLGPQLRIYVASRAGV